MKILLMLVLLPLASQGTLVTTTTDEDDGSLGGGTGVSLREAVKYSAAGSIVTFAPALSAQTIRLGLGEILINQSLTIDGSALSSPIKLSGDKTGNGKTTDDTPVLRLTAGSLTLRSLILSDANCGSSSGCITIRPSAPFDLLVDRCTPSGNSGYHAAALYVYSAATTDRITLQNSTISGNSVVKGSSAVSVFDCALSIRNCTFANNSTGAIHYRASANTASQLSVENSTIVGNKATYGAGGIHIDDSTADASLKNIICSGNTPADISGGFSGANILLAAYPDLAPLGDYGGPTQTMPPLPGSPAIDTGGTTTLITDQRGFPRVSTPDIGAAEYQGTSDLTRFWPLDFDGDASPYGTEQALGTDPLVADPANSRNLTAPALNASSHAVLNFGIAPAAPGTRWILKRSCHLSPGGFEEIYRFDGSLDTAAVGLSFIRTVTSVTVTDEAPLSKSGFYRFEALLEP